MHLLTLAKELQNSNQAVMDFVVKVVTIKTILQYGDNNEAQQKNLATNLENAINILTSQLWSDENV